MMEDYLKKIAENTSLRSSFYIVLSGKNSRIETSFSPPLSFESTCQYEIALVSLETYYSFPNIDTYNNKLKVFLKGKWENITIPTGCYELKAINAEVQRQIVELKGNKDDVSLTPNLNTFKCLMSLGKGIKVDLTMDDSIRSVLGFEKNIYSKPRNLSEHIVNIMRTNTIFVHTNQISSSYLNGEEESIIYSYFPDVSPGEKIVEQPYNLIYLPLVNNYIDQMSCWITDQNNVLLNLQDEQLSIKFHIRSC